MAENLASMKCEPCKGGIPPLKGNSLKTLHEQVKEWSLVGEHHLERTFEFSTFKDAIAFVTKLAMLAEENGHHPYIQIDYKKVKVIFFTHKIDGLHEADFIMAAKTDKLTG
ncbi:4a-hydroxytetrahydrobiopterin dehydratase [Candidatus Woesearchaeota archaeon]|nr:4a-hydroxytetrahydrobiopterin dehydratase [Candidatus Woesearchaeota archaeon]